MPSKPVNHVNENASLPAQETRMFGYVQPRGSAHSRGYDRRWQRVRLTFLKNHPFCNRCPSFAQEVHHVRPISEGGRKYDTTNLEQLCKRCHSSITAKAKGANHGRPDANTNDHPPAQR